MSASDVVQAALILLERREHDRDAALDEIRREIQLGIDRTDTVKVIHDREGQSEASSTDNEHGVVVMKDQAGEVIGIAAVSPLTTMPTRR